MEELKNIIASNLITLRKQLNLKQSDVADRLKYSDKTISKWETGEIVPSVENLVALCRLYGVTLDQITSQDLKITKDARRRKREQANKLTISSLAVSAVWILATIAFVYAKLLSKVVFWQVFVWAIPCSMIIAIIFNSVWWKNKLNFVFISVLIWTLITSIYLQFIKYNLIPLYFIGIPCQVAVLLWANIKKTK